MKRVTHSGCLANRMPLDIASHRRVSFHALTKKQVTKDSLSRNFLSGTQLRGFLRGNTDPCKIRLPKLSMNLPISN